MAIQTSTVTTTTFNIPKKGKAGVLVDEGPNFRMEIKEVDVPEPAPNEILIRINATGICYSDVHLMAGEMGVLMSQFGCRSTGHEGAGVVVKLGADVKDWKLGDRAGVKPIRGACGKCELCFKGRDNYYRAATVSGLTHPGTFQQYVTAPARYTNRIPDGVSDYVAGPLMCGGLTAYGSLKNSGLKTGNWVVIASGGGGVGIQVVQLAKAMGFIPVVIDSGDDKKKLALSRGAEAFVDFATSTNVTAEVKAIYDGVSAHGVVVTAHQSYANAVSFVGERIGAVIICIGLAPKPMTFGADPKQYALSNLKIIETAMGSQKDAMELLDFARRGLLTDIYEVRGLSALPKSVQDLRQGRIPGRIVINFNQP